MKRKVISLILSAVLLLSFSSRLHAEGLTQSFIFSDISSHWAKNKIEQLKALGISNGFPDGTYKPDKPISWAETITMLLKVLELEPVEGKDTLKVGNHWSRKYVEAAVYHGIIDPAKMGKFDPDMNIKRIEFARMIYNALDMDRIRMNPSPFADVVTDEDNDVTSRLFVDYLAGGSIKNGKRYFGINSNLSRAEAATLLINTRSYYNDKDNYIATKKKLAMEDKNLIKATKDEEFEKFINSEEASQYASVDYFRAENGVIIFKDGNGGWGKFGEMILDNSYYKAINKTVYITIKEAVKYARKYNKYVLAVYNSASNCVVIEYHSDRNHGEKMVQRGNINVAFYLAPLKIYEEKNKSEYSPEVTQFQKKDSFIFFNIRALWEEFDSNGYAIEKDFVEDRYGFYLNSLMKSIYGEKDGVLMYNYAIKEYTEECKKGNRRTNYSVLEINGIEIANANDTGAAIRFVTSLKQ